MDQTELGDVLGVQQPLISRWESDTVPMPANAWLTLAELVALGAGQSTPPEQARLRWFLAAANLPNDPSPVSFVLNESGEHGAFEDGERAMTMAQVLTDITSQHYCALPAYVSWRPSAKVQSLDSGGDFLSSAISSCEFVASALRGETKGSSKVQRAEVVQ